MTYIKNGFICQESLILLEFNSFIWLDKMCVIINFDTCI